MNSFIKKNWFVSLLVVVFVVMTLYYIIDTNRGKLKGKTSDGEDVVYSLGEEDVTASEFYDSMFKNGGNSVVYQAFVRQVGTQGVSTTSDMKKRAKEQASSVISNYASNYPTDYRTRLDSQLKALGYNGYDDLENYLIDYYKQDQIVTDYIDSHFDELKIRNISYLLVKLEEQEKPEETEAEETENTEEKEETAEKEHTPTEDEQKRMDAVDKAFADGKSFADVAKEFSEDPSTAEKGGVLGTVDVNTTRLDKAFLDAALSLKEGETSDWVYSENFGYFRIMVTAATPEHLMEEYKTANSLPEEQEVTMSEVYNSLLSSYDSTLSSKALWEKAEEIGITFTDEETQTKLKKYMGVDE